VPRQPKLKIMFPTGAQGVELPSRFPAIGRVKKQYPNPRPAGDPVGVARITAEIVPLFDGGPIMPPRECALKPNNELGEFRWYLRMNADMRRNAKAEVHLVIKAYEANSNVPLDQSISRLWITQARAMPTAPLTDAAPVIDYPASPHLVEGEELSCFVTFGTGCPQVTSVTLGNVADFDHEFTTDEECSWWAMFTPGTNPGSNGNGPPYTLRATNTAGNTTRSVDVAAS